MQILVDLGEDNAWEDYRIDETYVLFDSVVKMEWCENQQRWHVALNAPRSAPFPPEVLGMTTDEVCELILSVGSPGVPQSLAHGLLCGLVPDSAKFFLRSTSEKRVLLNEAFAEHLVSEPRLFGTGKTRIVAWLCSIEGRPSWAVYSIRKAVARFLPELPADYCGNVEPYGSREQSVALILACMADVTVGDIVGLPKPVAVA